MIKMTNIVLSVMLLACAQPAAALVSLGTCVVTVDNSVAFGNYNPLLGLGATTTGHFHVECNLLSIFGSYTVNLSTGGSGTYSPRKMSRAGGGGSLNYNLYMSDGTTIWGNGTGGTAHVSDSSLLQFGNFTYHYDIIGKIYPAQQTTPPGTYSDSITITVIYN